MKNKHWTLSEFEAAFAKVEACQNYADNHLQLHTGGQILMEFHNENYGHSQDKNGKELEPSRIAA